MQQAHAYDLINEDIEDPLNHCTTDNSTPRGVSYSQENYPNAWASFVEFDDEGWLLNPAAQPNQIGLFASRLQADVASADADTHFIVIAFVHGWHHNAHDSDCNVHEFRAMLNLAAARYAALPGKTKIVGLYVAWRGESLSIPALRYTTVLDRRNAAERVAKGDVRALFATLRKFEVEEAARHPGKERLRTVVVGHSFGGLIAFNGLSPAVLNELTATRPETETSLPTPLDKTCHSHAEWVAIKNHTPPLPRPSGVFPDLLILVNPAFEATRFEAIHQQSLSDPLCEAPTFPLGPPKVIVVTADNDNWTGEVFTTGQSMLTKLEAYPHNDAPGHHDDEKIANTHAIGFVDRYKTHRLCIQGKGDDARVVAAFTPSKTSPDRLEPYSPVWVMGAPAEIVDGHNGFFYAQPDESGKHRPLLLNWLLTMHIDDVMSRSPTVIAEKCDRVPIDW